MNELNKIKANQSIELSKMMHRTNTYEYLTLNATNYKNKLRRRKFPK